MSADPTPGRLRRALVACTLLCLAAALRAGAADNARLLGMLDEAERIRASDKAKARQLLDGVERDPAAQSDPRLIARVQLLECRLADTPAAGYRAVAAGMAAAERAHDAGVRAKLLGCRASTLMQDGKSIAAEQEYGAVLTLAKKLHDASLEAEAAGNIGYLGEYERRGQRSDLADTLFNIGSTFATKGDFAAAELHSRRALAAFQKLGQPADVAYTKRSLGLALTRGRRWPGSTAAWPTAGSDGSPRR